MFPDRSKTDQQGCVIDSVAGPVPRRPDPAVAAPCPGGRLGMSRTKAEPAVDRVTSAPAAVIGAGPAGLMLAHLLGARESRLLPSTAGRVPRSNPRHGAAGRARLRAGGRRLRDTTGHNRRLTPESSSSDGAVPVDAASVSVQWRSSVGCGKGRRRRRRIARSQTFV